MITIYSKQYNNKKNDKIYIVGEIRCLSTDTKPKKIGNKYIDNGTQLIEIDTGKIFIYDLSTETWKEI